MPSASFFTSSDSQKQWREHTRHNYTKNDDFSPCVFQVPDSLRDTKPQAYVPQIVGLGPFHHFRTDLQLTGSVKRAVVENYLTITDFNDFFNWLDGSPQEFERKIRWYYAPYLELDKETLSWIVILDGIFLLHFIDAWLERDENKRSKKQEIYTNFEKLVPDVFMLENQIPTVILGEMLELLKFRFDVSDTNLFDKSYKFCKEKLFDKFFEFCSEHSPLDLPSIPERQRRKAIDKNNHMLHCMYQMILKNDDEDEQSESKDDDNGKADDRDRIEEDEDDQRQSNKRGRIEEVGDGQRQSNKGGRIEEFGGDQRQSNNGNDNHDDGKSEEWEHFTKRMEALARVAGAICDGIIGHTIEGFNSAVSTVTNAGLQIPGDIQKISQILQYLEKITQFKNNKEAFSGEKIISSASRLMAFLGIRFLALPEGSGIGNIKLKIEGAKKEFHLPVIHMRANSEVILRNLVAYEATISKKQKGSTRLRDYVDLMCGLVRSEEDVKLLEEAKIIIIEEGIPRQKIVQICNGIKKSDEKPDEKSKVHSTVQKANSHFSKAALVKIFRWFVLLIAALSKIFQQLLLMAGLILLVLQYRCLRDDCGRRPAGRAAIQNHYLDDHLEFYPQAKLMLPRKILRY